MFSTPTCSRDVPVPTASQIMAGITRLNLLPVAKSCNTCNRMQQHGIGFRRPLAVFHKKGFAKYMLKDIHWCISIVSIDAMRASRKGRFQQSSSMSNRAVKTDGSCMQVPTLEGTESSASSMLGRNAWGRCRGSSRLEGTESGTPGALSPAHQFVAEARSGWRGLKGSLLPQM